MHDQPSPRSRDLASYARAASAPSRATAQGQTWITFDSRQSIPASWMCFTEPMAWNRESYRCFCPICE